MDGDGRELIINVIEKTSMKIRRPKIVSFICYLTDQSCVKDFHFTLQVKILFSLTTKPNINPI